MNSCPTEATFIWSIWDVSYSSVASEKDWKDFGYCKNQANAPQLVADKLVNRHLIALLISSHVGEEVGNLQTVFEGRDVIYWLYLVRQSV